jgi:hypothetical protein
VEIAGDPGALLGDCEQALAVRFPRDAEGAFLEFGQLVSP